MFLREEDEDDDVSRVSPDKFLKQCVAMGIKAGADPEEHRTVLARFEKYGIDIETSNQVNARR